MNYLVGSGPQATMEASYARPTLTDQLEKRKVELEEELASVSKVIELMKKAPEVREVLDAVSKLNLRY